MWPRKTKCWNTPYNFAICFSIHLFFCLWKPVIFFFCYTDFADIYWAWFFIWKFEPRVRWINVFKASKCRCHFIFVIFHTHVTLILIWRLIGTFRKELFWHVPPDCSSISVDLSGPIKILLNWFVFCSQARLEEIAEFPNPNQLINSMLRLPLLTWGALPITMYWNWCPR